MTLQFSETGPFDEGERQVIRDAIAAINESAHAQARELSDSVIAKVHQLDNFGDMVAGFPSLFRAQSLGGKKRDVSSLLSALSKSSPSNFDMFLPTRALASRTLVMGEVNFWRMLRFVCNEALTGATYETIAPRVDRRLCRCLYTRLAETVLIDIASDAELRRGVRDKSGLALMQIWEQTAYSVSEFFPVLEATWDARRRFPATLGTLMGTSEMFRLIEEGCDEAFVDYLVRDDRTADEEDAFREFLFGATTEHLDKIKEQMDASGKGAIGADEVVESQALRDACAVGRDPSLALFEFFLYRHLQASARRQANLPGPKRTAEEYVMLYYLEHESTLRVES